MDWKKTISKTFKYIFYGVALVQIVLGAIWTLYNLGHVPNWQITKEYLEISKTFVMDEYIFFIYPVLLRLTLWMEELIGLPYFIPVYGLQLFAAIGTGYAFARMILHLDKRDSWIATGYFLTFPMLLQFHLSIRPESMRLSALLAFLVLVKTILGAGKKKFWKFGVTSGVLGVILFGIFINAQLQIPGSRGRIQKTFWSAAFQRVVTDYFSRSYAIWDDDVRTTFTIEEAMEQAKRTDNMVYAVGPMLEADWGKERANELYKQMAIDCFRVRTKEVVFQIRDDLIDSVFMPFSTWWQKNGIRKSQTGWNYGVFKEIAPMVSKIYWSYSILGLFICVIGSIFTRIANRSIRYLGIILLPIAFIQCLYNVMSNGNRVDYRGLLFMIMFWCVLGCNIYKEKSEV